STDNSRRDQDDQLAFAGIEGAVLEELADDREVSQTWQLGDEFLLVVTEHAREHDRLAMPDRDAGLHFASSETGNADRASDGDGPRGVDFGALCLQIGLDISSSIRGGSKLENDAVLLVLDIEVIAGDQRDGNLAAGEKLRLLAAGADQPRLCQEPSISIVPLEA